ncbi:MAG: hypothetical protein WCE21_01195 [Candidatus Babeliales bacterium]
MNQLRLPAISLIVLSYGFSVSHAASSLRSLSSFILRHDQEVITHELAAAPGDSLLIQQLSGDITIEGWSSPRILIEALKTGNDEALKNTQVSCKKQGTKNILKTSCTNHTTEAWVDYTIRVPFGLHLQIEGAEGAVTVKNVSGTQQINWEVGNMSIHDAANCLTLKTNNGSIQASFATVPANTSVQIDAQGTIECMLFPDTVSDIRAHSEQAYVSSTIPITIKPFTTTLDKGAWNQFKQKIDGFLHQQGKSYINLHATRTIKITERVS